MEPWINHDRHRSKPADVKREQTKKPARRLKPYPTQERLLELFHLEDGLLIRNKPHGNERPDRVAGCINPKCGKRYIRVDDKQCKADRLIQIYLGRE